MYKVRPILFLPLLCVVMCVEPVEGSDAECAMIVLAAVLPHCISTSSCSGLVVSRVTMVMHLTVL